MRGLDCEVLNKYIDEERLRFKHQDLQSVMPQCALQGAYLSAHPPCQELNRSNQT